MPDSCRSLFGSVLPVAAARVVLPAALQKLDRQQMTAPPPELLWERGGVALRERTRDTKSGPKNSDEDVRLGECKVNQKAI